jgi:hypothetical protein
MGGDELGINRTAFDHGKVRLPTSPTPRDQLHLANRRFSKLNVISRYAMVDRATQFGSSRETIVVIDDDLGRSGATIEGPLGFRRLVADGGGAPRFGSAVLSGVTIRGRCGMRMTAHYSSNGHNGRYVCVAIKSN